MTPIIINDINEMVKPVKQSGLGPSLGPRPIDQVTQRSAVSAVS